MSRRQTRRDGRAAEGDGLLNRYTGSNPYPGFESPSLRSSLEVFKLTGKGAAVVRSIRRRLWISGLLCAFFLLTTASALAQYSVKYDNGATVEVIAVSKLPSRHKPFWDPAGKKLVDPPYEFRDASNGPKAPQNGYEVVLRISGVEDRVYFPYRPPAGGITVGYPSTVFAANPAQEQLRVIEVTVPDGTDVIDFELAMAANTWKTIRSFKAAGAYGDGPDRVSVVELKDNEKISHPDTHYWVHLAPSENALRAIAIDEDGKSHISTGLWGMGSQEHTLYLQFPSLAREKVKEYRVEKCSYESKSLNLIHLKPPGDWDALVLQSRINRLMAQELKFNPQVDQARIDEDIEKIVRLKIFEDTDNWIIAVRDLTQIGPPAIPAIVAE